MVQENAKFLDEMGDFCSFSAQKSRQNRTQNSASARKKIQQMQGKIQT